MPSAKVQPALSGATDDSQGVSEATDSTHTSNKSNAEVNSNHATEFGAFNETETGSTDGSHRGILSSTTNNPETLASWVNVLQHDENGRDDKTLHERIIDLLSYCGVGHLFREIQAYPFQFFVELPEFSGDEQYDGQSYPLDKIHPYARDIWWLLAGISHQLDATNDAFMAIPNDSFFM